MVCHLQVWAVLRARAAEAAINGKGMGDMEEGRGLAVPRPMLGAGGKGGQGRRKMWGAERHMPAVTMGLVLKPLRTQGCCSACPFCFVSQHTFRFVAYAVRVNCC